MLLCYVFVVSLVYLLFSQFARPSCDAFFLLVSPADVCVP